MRECYLGYLGNSRKTISRKGRALFVLLLFALLGVMSVGADYGARMVYDYNAGGNACPQLIEFAN